MEFIRLAIPEVVLITPLVHSDPRGFFLETFRQSEFEENCAPLGFVQENHSGSRKGVLRGLHLQTARPQGKLVRALRGSIFDVAVDVRLDSKTFGKWVAAELSADNHRQLWVPPGFAHGFFATSDNVEIGYKCTDYYAPELERTLSWNDPTLAITWPILPGEAPIISEKDSKGLLLDDFVDELASSNHDGPR